MLMYFGVFPLMFVLIAYFSIFKGRVYGEPQNIAEEQQDPNNEFELPVSEGLKAKSGRALSASDELPGLSHGNLRMLADPFSS